MFSLDKVKKVLSTARLTYFFVMWVKGNEQFFKVGLEMQ